YGVLSLLSLHIFERQSGKGVTGATPESRWRIFTDSPNDPTAFRAGKGLRVPIAAMWRMFDGLVFAPTGSSNRFTTTAASSA
ncbi:hypothetical protein, partial [Paraburkholderia sp. SIMBA_030]|uniref:hypothetical protein n=1 Tax=Paraburkholderia sp. SIMBA_030 TaxID=3085773 RepID=UPI00397DC2B7